MQTTSVRWNLSGQAFEPLRTLLYYQSRELSRAVDEVGEHLRSLGAALSFNHQMLEQAGSVADCEPDADAVVLVRQLVEAHEAVERTTEAVLEAGIAWGDGATVALARARQLVHARMRKTLAIASPAPL
jgi:starvation-inducible DNA-binding protein